LPSLAVLDRAPALRGRWRLEVYEGDIERDAGGRVANRLVEVHEGENLVVDVGKQMVLDRLFGLSAVGAVSRIGVGTSGTAPAPGNTTLTGGVFVAFDSTPTRSGLVVTAVATFGTGTANIVWAEIGMDNGTTLLNRLAPIGPITKTSALAIVATLTLTAT
jgi:hypothetical protein